MASFGLEEVASTEGELHFDRDMHVAYFKSCLRKGFPHQYTSMDTQRMTAVYFSLSALDMLGEVESLDKAKLIDFVYSWQLESRSPAHGGFVGTSSMGNPLGGCLCFERGDAGGAGSCERESVSGDCCIMKGHLAMAYTSLASLIILGDDSLSRVNRPALVAQMRALQQTDGSFAASGDEAGECDVRFVYCACVVSYLLGDWDGVNKSAALRFVLSCVTYEGGLALRPGGEAHGGSCYCGVASIMLMGLMDEAEEQLPGFRRGVQEFCQWRQVGGYQGRTNKPPDSCYSFWHGGSLRMLGKHVFDDSDLVGTERFLLTQCQSSLFGGFSKLPQPCMPDVLHSHYSLTWLSMAIEAHAPTEDGADADGDWIGGDLRGHEGGGAHLVPVKCYAPLRAVDAATGICRERLSSFLAGKK